MHTAAAGSASLPKADCQCPCSHKRNMQITRSLISYQSFWRSEIVLFLCYFGIKQSTLTRMTIML